MPGPVRVEASRGNTKLAEWLEAAAVSAQQIARKVLAARELAWSGLSRDPMPGSVCGIYVPLMMDGSALQLGVLGRREVCAGLASALLGESEPPTLGEGVFDGVGEIANLIAGNFKLLLADQIDVQVGIPLATKGRVIALGGSHSIHGVLTIDQLAVWLVITGPKSL